MTRATPLDPAPRPRAGRRGASARGPGQGEPAAPMHLLRHIFERQPLSQSNLRDLSGFSMSTVSQTVRRLAAHGIVRELGHRKEQVGRPQVLLGIDPGFASVIGVQLNAERNRVVMTALGGRLVNEQALKPGPLTPGEVADALARFLKAVPGGRVAGVGVSLAGLVDAATGTCVASTVLGWRDVPVASLLAARLGLPVQVENDANALALATMVFGQLGSVASAAIVTLGEGIGAAIVLDRQLYRGRHGSAGEIGHMKVSDAPTPPCHCGQTGCLEMMASSRAVLQAIAEATGGRVRASTLVELDGRAEPEVAAILQRAGHHLGASLAGLALTLDPDAVYLAMEPYLASRILIEAVTSSFGAHRFKLGRPPTPLRFLTDIDRMWALGAAGIAVGKYIDQIASSLSDDDPA